MGFTSDYLFFKLSTPREISKNIYKYINNMTSRALWKILEFYATYNFFEIYDVYCVALYKREHRLCFHLHKANGKTLLPQFISSFFIHYVTVICKCYCCACLSIFLSLGRVFLL